MLSNGLLIVVFVISFTPSRAQDVYGCGGFVRSRFPIDFGRIQAKLFTKNGVQKGTAECAPTNGYFLLPVYDEGEYVLKLEPPFGWTFDPPAVHLTVDGETDVCSRSQDINFDLLGFTVYGQVLSLGRSQGPRGVTVELLKGDGGTISTMTENQGRFWFGGVAPGIYKLMASHPVWSVRKAEVSVKVVADSAEVSSGSLVVTGFDVKGLVRSKKEPIAKVQFLLYPSSTEQQLDCENVPVSGVQSQPSCVTLSGESGEFTFSSLPPGQYKLVPHYHHDQIVFEVLPAEMVFVVANDTIQLKPAFEVQGFSVTGRVLRSAEGPPIVRATVYESGVVKTTTNGEGRYQLFNITTGDYMIMVEAPDMEFDELQIYVTPATPYLVDIIPTRFAVCGSIVMTQPLGKGVTVSREVYVFNSTSRAKAVQIKKSDQKGNFCFMLPPGSYQVEVAVSELERQLGLLFLPASLPLTLVDTPIHSDVTFTQYTTTLTGTLLCKEACPPGVKVHFEREYPGSQQVSKKTEVTVQPSSSMGHFKFDGVLPGKGTVDISNPVWCWKEQSILVSIAPDHIPTLVFEQSGYLLRCMLSHDAVLSYHMEGIAPIEVGLKRGNNSVCLNTPGVYTVKTKSCHWFGSETYTFDTASPVRLNLTSQRHWLDVMVTSPQKTDITLLVRSLRYTGRDHTHKPTLISEVKQGGGGTAALFEYKFSFLVSPGDELELIPKSMELMFTPSYKRHTVMQDCPEVIDPFQGSLGLILTGHVIPPLPGVTISIQLNDADTLIASTDQGGVWRVGPVHGDKALSVQVSAEKAGYLFEPMEGDVYSFRARKLSSIVIKVTTQDGNPLPDVLFSLSGANFRSNNFTNKEGSLTYYNLNPGQYYAKPLLREYEFSPAAKVISLEQGASEDVVFTGKRVAYSCTGATMSLNRQPEPGVTVEATGVTGSSCENYTEVATSDSRGVYRLRGLVPSCRFVVAVRKGEGSDITSSIPASKTLQLSSDEDLTDANFIVLYKTKTVTISGCIVADSQFFNTLRVVVYPEKHSITPLATVTPDGAGYFDISALPVDPKRKYHVTLETVLSLHSHKFSIPEVSVVPDHDKHITLQFHAEERTVEKENTQGSLLGLLGAVAFVFILANFPKVLGYVQGLVAPRGSASPSTGRKR
ncbi:hypothetical protein EMCRGX_G015685 [Ephydatia muelleri]